MTNSVNELPHNIDAERAVLGAMLLKNGESIIKVQSILTAEDFFNEENKIIYQAMIDLYEQENSMDQVTLINYLEKNNLIKQVGGPTMIMALDDMIPTDANIISHAKIIKEHSSLRKLISAGEFILNECYANDKPLEEIMDSAEQKIFSVTARDHKEGFEHISPILKRVFKKINYLYENNGGYTGVSVGIRELDEVTAGFQNSDLILLAARPSMGKTAFALNMASNVAGGFKEFKPRGVAIFSMEMSKEQLAQRMLSTATEIDAQSLKKGQLTRENWITVNDQMKRLSKQKLYIDDTPALTVLELRAKARHLTAIHDISLIIIDYLQLMQGHKSKNGESNRQQEISEISRSLKALARELNVPVIALSQLSRAVEMRAEKRPQLSDLRESGSLEQDADIVMFIYREDYYEINKDNENTAEIIIAKNRNGPTTSIKVHFQKNIMRFSSLSNRRDGE